MEYREPPLIVHAVTHEISLEGSRHQLAALPASQLSPLDRLIVAQESALLQQRLNSFADRIPMKPFDKDARLDRSAIWMQKAAPAVSGLRENGVVTYGQLHDRLHRLAPSHNVDGRELNDRFEDLLKGKFYVNKYRQDCYENTDEVTSLFALSCKIADTTVKQALSKPGSDTIAPRLVSILVSSMQQP